MRRLSSVDAGFDEQLADLLAWDTSNEGDLAQQVSAVIAEVQKTGDAAVIDYTRRFDRYDVANMAALRVSADELQSAFVGLPAIEAEALGAAAQRVSDYHNHQGESSWSYEDSLGNELGQKVTALRRIGVYVPGGQAAYPSTVLMTVIPARVAGVQEVVMVVPTPDALRNPLVLAAAHIAGVDEVITIGGAQAIAALAYGTQTIERVDKIVGPGGAYVAEAKRQVFGPVDIDMIAGPLSLIHISEPTRPY